jgi:hypothetical protein
MDTWGPAIKSSKIKEKGNYLFYVPLLQYYQPLLSTTLQG